MWKWSGSTLAPKDNAAMSPDPLLLATAQVGLNIRFHILFPSITIALA